MLLIFAFFSGTQCARIVNKGLGGRREGKEKNNRQVVDVLTGGPELVVTQSTSHVITSQHMNEIFFARERQEALILVYCV